MFVSQVFSYVPHAFRDKHVMFQANGNRLCGYGLGRAPGQLDIPLGIVVADGTIFVADSNNHRIEAFAPLQ